MKKFIKKLSIGLVSVVTVFGLSGGGGVVLAQTDSQDTLRTNLAPLNDSGASGTATVDLIGDSDVRVRINITGASPDLPHAQHFHIGGQNTCPDPSADENGDGFVDSAEGAPAYGPVRVSLSTEGDTSSDSGLAVDRAPVADAEGNISYDRTFTLEGDVTHEDVRNAVIVHHGISELFGEPDAYDGEPRSSLDEELPLEATIPAACGALASTPTNGVNAGSQAIDNTLSATLIGIGALSAVAATGLVVNRRLNS